MLDILDTEGHTGFTNPDRVQEILRNQEIDDDAWE
jgi:hypothetical protein